MFVVGAKATKSVNSDGVANKTLPIQRSPQVTQHPCVAAGDWSSEPCVKLSLHTAFLAIVVGYNRGYGPLTLPWEAASRTPYFS
jgi:hypothetical protein